MTRTRGVAQASPHIDEILYLNDNFCYFHDETNISNRKTNISNQNANISNQNANISIKSVSRLASQTQIFQTKEIKLRFKMI